MGAPDAVSTKDGRWLWRVLFAIALVIHFALVTRNWSAGALRGHEFRQTQTALSAYYIQVESNFSLAYPTPLFGKPWSVPMEFPLYQWAVVGLSNGLHMPLAPAGRTVSLLCFYLTLPALFCLLGRLRVGAGARWLTLALVVSCPLYIFYTRAFLIEAMALMFAVWFVFAFIAGMQTGRRGWMLLAALAGVGAALVKVTTLMMWMAPAAGWSLYRLRQSWSRDRADVGRMLGCGVAMAAAPCAAAVWWVLKSDAIKRLNFAGQFLQSDSMRDFNFGSWAERFSAESWHGILHNWNTAVMPWWLMGAGAVAIALAPGPVRRLALTGAAVFLGTQLLFPRLFNFHDYYFYAIAVFWLGAFAIALSAVIESWVRRTFWGVALATVLVAVQFNAYRVNYAGLQNAPGNGGTGLTDALRSLTSRDGVLIVVGDDWSAITPYYAERRALMVRENAERDPAFRAGAFASIAGEEVAALVVFRANPEKADVIAAAIKAFDLHPEVAFSHVDTDVYLPRSRWEWAVAKLRANPVFARVEARGNVSAHAMMPPASHDVKVVNPARDRGMFGHMSPMPIRYHFSYAPDIGTENGRVVLLGAHPDSEIWFAPPAGMREIECVFGIMAGAYEREGPSTDGVEFIIIEHRPDGIENVLYRRRLRPPAEAKDRGAQRVVLPCRPVPGAELVFLTRPVGDYAFDWAYWGPITLR